MQRWLRSTRERIRPRRTRYTRFFRTDVWRHVPIRDHRYNRAMEWADDAVDLLAPILRLILRMRRIFRPVFKYETLPPYMGGAIVVGR